VSPNLGAPKGEVHGEQGDLRANCPRCRDPRRMDGTPLQLAPVWDSGWGKHTASRVREPPCLQQRNTATDSQEV
jgi:hypothetical protein